MTDKLETVEFGGQVVEIPRMTVVQMCAAMTGETEPGPDKLALLGSLMFEDMTLAQLARITGVPLSALENATPPELGKLINQILEVNPHWAQTRRRIIEYGRSLQQVPATED